MPRLRVDRTTSEYELRVAIINLFAASHVIDEKLADPRISRSQRVIRENARDDIHDEIERLTNIIRKRRTLVTH